MAEGAWNWRPRRRAGIWEWGPKWSHPLCAAAPWVTAALLGAMLLAAGARLVSEPGVVCELPDGAARSDLVPSMAALMIPARGESGAGGTLVYFDDARYDFSDAAGADMLRQRLARRAVDSSDRTLLLLVDRNVPNGEVVKLAETARSAGVKRVQVAQKGAAR